MVAKLKLGIEPVCEECERAGDGAFTAEVNGFFSSYSKGVSEIGALGDLNQMIGNAGDIVLKHAAAALEHNPMLVIRAVPA